MARIEASLGGLMATHVADAMDHIMLDGTAGPLEEIFEEYDNKIEQARELYGNKIPTNILRRYRKSLIDHFGNQWSDIGKARTQAQEKKAATPQV